MSKEVYRVCQSCDGTGKVMRHPYYTEKMPEEQEQKCEECLGHGKFLVVRGNIRIIRD